MMFRIAFRGVAMLLWLTAAVPCPAFSPDIDLEGKIVDHVQASPDGRRVVFTITEVVETEDRRISLTHVYMASTDGSNIRLLTSGEYACTDPRWSPDGKWIAFLSRRGDHSDLSVMGSSGKPVRGLTHVTEGPGVIGFRWSPSGNRIAYVMPDPSAPENQGGPDAPSRGVSRLWVIPFVPEREAPAVPYALTGPDIHVVFSRGLTGFDWSPDGRHIAFVHRTDLEGWQGNDISVVETATGFIMPLSRGGRSEFGPLYSPDGRWIAYLVEDRAADTPVADFRFDVFLIPANGGQPFPLAATPDRWPTLVGWSRDSQQIYFTERYGGKTHLAALPVNGKPPRDLLRQNGTLEGITLNASRTVFGFTAIHSGTGEVFVMPLNRLKPFSVSGGPANPNRLQEFQGP